MSFFDGLVKDNTAVTVGDVKRFFSNPEQAAAFATQNTVAPQSATFTDPGIGAAPATIPMPEGVAGPEQLDPTQDPNQASSPYIAPRDISVSNPGVTPQLSTPSFKDVAVDQYGNLKQNTPQLTKMGTLLKVLIGGAQGAAAGAGSRTFGEGFQRAQAAPYQKMTMVNNARQEELQTQQAQQAQAMQNTPLTMSDGSKMPFWLWKRGQDQKIAEAGLDNKISETNKNNAETNAKLHPDDKKVADYVNPDGKQVVSFQKADGSTYDKVLGDVRAPRDTNTFQVWHDSFLKENKREPSTQEIAQYDKSHAQNTHITNVNGPAATAESDYNYVAEQLLRPDNLTALKDVAGRGGKERAHIFALTSKLAESRGMKFDSGLIDQRINYLKGYENPTGKASLNRDSMNNILMHSGDLLDMNNYYRRYDERFLNTPVSKISEQFGGTQFTQFDTINSVLKDEIALYFAAGYAPTKEQLATWNRIQASSATPAQTEAFAREIARVGLRRATTHNSNFKSMMGYDDPNLIIPEAASAAERLGLGDEVRKFGSGGRVGSPGSGNSSNGGGGNAPHPLEQKYSDIPGMKIVGKH